MLIQYDKNTMNNAISQSQTWTVYELYILPW